jgi:uncharacterized RDD family membrane protein YckC
MFCSSCGANISGGSKFCPSCGSVLAAQSQARPPQVTPSPLFPAAPVGRVMDYATWGSRAIGYLIDSLLVAPVLLILYFVLSGLLAGLASLGGRDVGGAFGATCCVFIVLFPLASLAVGLYNRVYLIASRGYSIGQGVMKIKVVDANGALLTQGTALIRLLAQLAMGFVPVLPLLDLLWPLWDDRRQTLHDKAVGCYVINNPQTV